MLGFLIVLLSAFLFCFQNVVVRVLFSAHPVLGLGTIGGFVTPTLHHSFLLLLMRMLLVVPLMSVLANTLYPTTWQTIAQLRQPQHRSLLLQSLVGGLLMFLYLAVLYISIGLIPTGIALTLFFTYPVFTALLSWRWFNDRPTLFRWIVMAGVLFGSALTMPQANPLTGSREQLIGIVMGLASGVIYAFYTVVAQKSFQTLHPVPFTWISFATSLLLAGICLLLWPGTSEAPLPWVPLWIGSLLSALFTFGGHLLNNLGIRQIGASTAAMVAATNPVLTVILAWLVIQESLTSVQILGVAIATISVAALSQKHRTAKSS